MESRHQISNINRRNLPSGLSICEPVSHSSAVLLLGVTIDRHLNNWWSCDQDRPVLQLPHPQSSAYQTSHRQSTLTLPTPQPAPSSLPDWTTATLFCMAFFSLVPIYADYNDSRIASLASSAINPHARHHMPLLHSLHWLPVERRIQYKIALLRPTTDKVKTFNQPSYLRQLICDYEQLFTDRFIAKLLLSACWKKCENRSIFDEVMTKTLWRNFLTRGVPVNFRRKTAYVRVKTISQLRFDCDTTTTRLRQKKIHVFVFCSRRIARDTL